MKRILLFIILMVHCALGFVYCQSDDWQRAEQLYADKQYAAAADLYKSMFQYGESADLYYNYANALYKSNQIGLAILNYERALRLDPTNEDIKFNLDFVNRMKTDKIEPIERFFLAEWLDALALMMTSNQWAYASIIGFVCMLILTLMYLFGRKVWLRKTAFFSALFLLLFSKRRAQRLERHLTSTIFPTNANLSIKIQFTYSNQGGISSPLLII